MQDGTILHGIGFGAKTEAIGELVFNTSMMGYQEALTDPSYGGQILLMTYPLIGNYGINKQDSESGRIHPAGFVVRCASPDYQHKDSEQSLHGFLESNNVPGIQGIDTRFIVRHIRDKGVMPAILAVSDKELDTKKMLEKSRSFDYSAIDFVSKVSIKKTQIHQSNARTKKRVALIDYGAKGNIVRELVSRGCEVHIVPYDTPSSDIRSIKPDGIMLSNGPGDPAILTGAHKTIRELSGDGGKSGNASRIPIFGICLGHQLLAHAFGGDTYKLKFGHRGSNHAVIEQESKRISITTQNHGFAVGKAPEGFEVTHINVNDKTIEGMSCEERNILSVQYHPEACPGPHDSKYLFDRFMEMMED